jgi:hypothetical protein
MANKRPATRKRKADGEEKDDEASVKEEEEEESPEAMQADTAEEEKPKEEEDGKPDTRALLDTQISKLVTQGLWDEDGPTVEAALTEVANLSFGNPHAGPNRVTISLTGGLLAIVKAMDRHAGDADVQAAGGRALQNLALDQNNKGGIASAGGIEVLVNAMKKFPEDASVQMGGCGTFQVSDDRRVTWCVWHFVKYAQIADGSCLTVLGCIICYCADGFFFFSLLLVLLYLACRIWSGATMRIARASSRLGASLPLSRP